MARFTAAEITRAIKGAREAGIVVERCDIAPDGTISVICTETVATKKALLVRTEHPPSEEGRTAAAVAACRETAYELIDTAKKRRAEEKNQRMVDAQSYPPK
jgi:aerobic-type carbon monoxide dehydrogenase small subunit (CoxS/CutS family)